MSINSLNSYGACAMGGTQEAWAHVCVRPRKLSLQTPSGKKYSLCKKLAGENISLYSSESRLWRQWVREAQRAEKKGGERGGVSSSSVEGPGAPCLAEHMKGRENGSIELIRVST